MKPREKADLNLDDLSKQVFMLKGQKDALNKKIIDVLKKKETQTDGQKKSRFDLLIDLLEYKAPILFEEMIANWENSCRENGCNYLAIEYSEFTREGGTQLAINAKPKFIQKALELCGGRAVLYIDGDMTVRQYPAIFDMDNVDFMARGWWIDPRSSWKMTESIMYDPYNFETSGGIMFFLSSEAAKKLIASWIEIAEKPINDGKADDRVLSLIFNTRSILTWIRVISLPIEYLWLTLDYDERMLSEVYDYNKAEMESTIIIDHPECLTSEDTAAGAGASLSRQPKFYDFLEDVYPCLEMTHEYIMFKELVSKYPDTAKHITEYMRLSDAEKNERESNYNNEIGAVEEQLKLSTLSAEKIVTLKADREKIKKQKTQTIYLPYFFWYYHYMGGIQYINDGNHDLIDLGFVDPENPEDNAAPLTIISYKDKFGDQQHPQGDGESYNKIVDINTEAANELNLDDYYKENPNKFILQDKQKFVEIVPADFSFTTNKNLMRVILRLLINGKTIILNPSRAGDYTASLYNKLVENLETTYKNVDLVFKPDHLISEHRSSIYKPKINMNQIILFRPESRLIDFLSMQLLLEDFSIFISNGSYEFMSLIRVAYILPSKDHTCVKHGGNKSTQNKFNLEDALNEYIEEFESTPSSRVICKSNDAVQIDLEPEPKLELKPELELPELELPELEPKPESKRTKKTKTKTKTKPTKRTETKRTETKRTETKPTKRTETKPTKRTETKPTKRTETKPTKQTKKKTKMETKQNTKPKTNTKKSKLFELGVP